MSLRITSKKNHYIILFLLICCAVTIRIVYFNGFLGSDDADYNKASFVLSKGDFLINSHHSKRLGLILPTALAFRIFGFSEISSVLFLLLCSVANIVIAYGAGCIFFNKEVGLLALLLSSFLPIDTIYATVLLPDLPFLTSISVSALLFIYAEVYARRYRNLLSFLCGLSMGWAYLIKETALLFVFLLCIWMFVLTIMRYGKFNTSWFFVGLGFLFIVVSECCFYYYKTGNVFERVLSVSSATHNISRWLELTYDGALYKRLTYAVPYVLLRGNYIFGFYFYLIFGGLLYAILNKSKELKIFILWFVSSYLVLNFGTTSVKTYTPLLASPRHFYPLIFPGIFIISFYLYDAYNSIVTHDVGKVRNFCVSLIGIDVILIILNVFERTFTDVLFGLLLTILILYGVYAVIQYQEEIDKVYYIIPILLGAVLLHSLYVVHVENKGIRELTNNERITVSLLGVPPGKKIYTDRLTEGRLEYFYAYRYDDVIMDFMDKREGEVSDCYIIINEENMIYLKRFYGMRMPDFVINPPDTWKTIKRFRMKSGMDYIIMHAS